MSYQIEVLANAHCVCGENPYWDADARRVLWTDIENGRLYQYAVDSGEWGQFYSGELVGGFTMQIDGSLLLFRDHNICRLSPDGTETILAAGVAEGSGRFNDVIADPAGRVFAGTMGHDGSQENGGLFRVDYDGTATEIFLGTGCSNGMGFTPDLNHFYWTDSSAGIVYHFDYDINDSSLSNRSIFLRFDPDAGIPDGLTIDTQGNIWQAFWGGSAIRKFSPAGEQLEEIILPVSAVSSCTFGGTDLNELYITTAEGADESEGDEGTLYRVRVEATGRLEFRSRIGM